MIKTTSNGYCRPKYERSWTIVQRAFLEELESRRSRNVKFYIIHVDLRDNAYKIQEFLFEDIPFWFRKLAKILYEFNSFVTDLISCVNYLTDLKSRLLDGHNKKYSMTIGQYCESKNKQIKNQGKTHQILCESYEEWVSKINEIRNTIIHDFVADELYATWHGEVSVSQDSEFRSKHEMKLKLPSFDHDIDLYEYCVESLETLKKFLNSALTCLDEDMAIEGSS